jgi:mandelamide amidase
MKTATNKVLYTAQPAAADTDALAELGVSTAAAAIRRGELTAERYAGALLDRARTHADLNAFITIDEAAVLAAARDADKARANGSTAPLLGVPLAIKDSYLTQGLRTTLGTGNLATYVPDRDADIVRMIRNAGGIVFGKNNLVEMSYGLTGHNAPYGQARNPHNREHVTGGSSSGAGASVAARIVPAAFGGDTVGSVRVPASFNGVVGFKPTPGRWSADGVAPISHTLDTPGLLARFVEDCILVDQLVTRSSHLASASRTDLEGLRFAYAPRQHLDLLEPEVERRFDEVLRQLRDAGAEITEIDLGSDFAAITERATWRIFFHETMDAVAQFLRANSIPTTFEHILDTLKPRLKDTWQHLVVPSGAGYSHAEYEAAMLVDRPEIQRRLEGAYASAGADGILFPTTPRTAPEIERQTKFLIGDREVGDLVLAKNTIGGSLAGLPGISIPMGLAGNGLPFGLEIDAPRHHDSRLLDVARRVERVIGNA